MSVPNEMMRKEILTKRIWSLPFLQSYQQLAQYLFQTNEGHLECKFRSNLLIIGVNYLPSFRSNAITSGVE